jgi:hypothetical protein
MHYLGQIAPLDTEVSSVLRTRDGAPGRSHEPRVHETWAVHGTLLVVSQADGAVGRLCCAL